MKRSKPGDFNAAYSSNALYYLSNEEITLIRLKLLPECDVVMFVSYEPKPDLKNNDYLLSKWWSIEEFLNTNGFDTVIKDKESKWVTVVGRK